MATSAASASPSLPPPSSAPNLAPVPATLRDIGHLQQVEKIVDAELARANEKSADLAQSQTTKSRQAYMLSGSSNRAKEYTYLVAVAVATLTVCAVLAAVNAVINSGLLTMLIAVVFMAGMVILYMGYVGILRRDATDFDQVNPASLIDAATLVTPTTANMISAGVTGTGEKITSPVGACVGKDCCDQAAGTAWDPVTYRCVIQQNKTIKVVNGGFTLPAAPANTWVRNVPIPGWTATTDIQGTPAPLSRIYLVNGTDKNFNVGQALPAGATQCVAIQLVGAKQIRLTQPISFLYAGEYKLSFYVRGRASLYNASHQVTATLAGASVTTAIAPGAAWAEYTLKITITKADMLPLTFATSQTATSDSSVLLTQVTITAV